MANFHYANHSVFYLCNPTYAELSPVAAPGIVCSDERKALYNHMCEERTRGLFSQLQQLNNSLKKISSQLQVGDWFVVYDYMSKLYTTLYQPVKNGWNLIS
jgi:hypothetical protein